MTYQREKLAFARQLRKNQTESEKVLWRHLRNSQIDGIKFRRQQIIGPYVVDFFSFERKLVIEVDGGQHNSERGRENDKTRTDWLEKQGYIVARFWNNDILTNIDGVMDRIHRFTSSEFTSP